MQYEYKDNYCRHKFKRLTNFHCTVVSAGQGHASRCLARVEDSHLPAALSGKGGSSAELIPWYWLRFLFREPQQVNTTKIEKNKLGAEFFLKNGNEISSPPSVVYPWLQTWHCQLFQWCDSWFPSGKMEWTGKRPASLRLLPFAPPTYIHQCVGRLFGVAKSS